MGDDVRSTLAAIARRWVEEGWRRGDGAIVDELHAPGFVDHDSGDRAPDNDGFREGIVRLYAAFPDFHAEVRDLVVEVAGTCAGAFPGGATPGGASPGGTVAVRWTAAGTHRAPYLGAAPTNRRTTFQGIEVIRIENGLITERWGEWDGIGLLGQLGRFP